MKGELVLSDAAEQFDAGDRRGRAIMVLEAEHGTGPGLDPSVVISIRLFRYFDDRSLLRFHALFSFGISRTARCDAM